MRRAVTTTSAVDPLVSGMKAATDAFKQVLKEQEAMHQQRVSQSKKMLESCFNIGETGKSGILDMSSSVTELGPWKVFPGNDCVKVFDTCQICASEHRSSLRDLAHGWRHRHVGMKDPLKKKQVKGVKLPSCLQEGVCHCKRSPQGRSAASLRDSARAIIRALCNDQKDAFVDGRVVLYWRGRSSLDGSLSHKLVFVPLMYLKPLRPTLLELTLPSAEEARLSKMFPEHGEGFKPQDAEEYIQVEVKRVGNKPSFNTFLQFCGSLDAGRQWWIGMLLLSDRKAIPSFVHP